MKTCWGCDGRAVVVHEGFFAEPTRSRSEPVRCRWGVREARCTICDGIGWVPDDHDPGAGQRLRARRISRKMSLREAADELGITLVEYCRRERGGVPLSAPTAQRK